MAKNLEWVIIVQLNPSTDLFGYCETVFNELKKLPVSDKVKVIVVLSSLNSIQKSSGNLSEIDFSKPLFYEMSPDVSMFAPNLNIKVDDLVTVDNMETFFKEVKSSFEANKYCYVVKDHGSGSAFSLNNSKYIQKIVRYKGKLDNDDEIRSYFSKTYKINGYNLESTFPLGGSKKVYMLLYVIISKNQVAQTIKNFASASSKAGINWDVFCMDCCWGQMLENSYNMRKVASYNVACQDEGPIKGFDMNINIDSLIKYPTTKPVEFAKYICASFYSSNYLDYSTSEDFKNIGICISVLDNTKSVDIVTKLNALVKLLTNLLIDHLSISKFIKARMFCEDYMYDSGREFREPTYSVFTIDLVHFLENLISVFPSESALVETCNDIIKFVLYHFVNINVTNNYVDFSIGEYTIDRPQAKGVSFYFPVKIEHWNGDIYETDQKNWFEKDCHWARFLNELLSGTIYKDLIKKVIDKHQDPEESEVGRVLSKLIEINEKRKILW